MYNRSAGCTRSVPIPAGNYMFKVNNRNTRNKVRNMFKVYNKDTRTTPMACSSVFIVNFEQVNAEWDEPRTVKAFLPNLFSYFAYRKTLQMQRLHMTITFKKK